MSDDTAGTKISELWGAAWQFTRNHCREYHLNHAYLEGYQWLQWSPSESRVDILPEDLDRIQATVNRMRSNHRTLMADLTQRELSFEVVPTAGDDATLRAARIASGLLVDLAHRHDWERLRDDHIRSTMKGGTGAIAVSWSSKNDTTVETVLGVTEFVVEPGSRNGETARWWIQLQLLPPATVQSMWPDWFPSPPQADGRTGQGRGYDYREDVAPTTRVYTYYERPNPLCPEGRVLVEVAGKRVEELPWPFPWKDRLNLAIAKETPIENEAYGSTVLSDVRQLQTALNGAWSAMLEHLAATGNTRLLLDENWDDSIRTLNDRAGAPLLGPFDKGKPDWLTAPGIPTTSIQVLPELKLAIDDLMGVHDVSRGVAPANVESGYGISILSENDSSPVGRLIKETARVWSKVAWMVLELHQAQVTETRTTSIRTGSGPVRRRWKGSDIHGQTDVQVPLDAIIPRSRAAQRAFADQALTMGLISPQDPLGFMKYARLSDMPDRRSLVQAISPDVDKAIRENEMVVLEEIPLPREFDDHQVHITVHNDFRKSAEYELMEEQQRVDIDNHVKVHEQFAMEAAGKQRMRAEIDPALGAAPVAEGAAPVDPLPPEEPMPEMGAEGDAGVEPIGPDQATNDMLQAITDL